jgi:hypothetical protein
MNDLPFGRSTLGAYMNTSQTLVIIVNVRQLGVHKIIHDNPD